MKLRDYIGETSAYDKKLMLERDNPISWLKSVSAFANTLGGKLLFGVSNEGALVGLADAEKDAEAISETIKMQILDAYKAASIRLGREFVPTFHSDATDFVVTLPNLQYGMRDIQNVTDAVKSATSTTHNQTGRNCMSLLQQVKTGKEAQPPRIMIYGSEGVGKSTFAASAPKPIFIQTEDGLGEIDCAKFPLVGSFDEMMAQLAAVRDEEHEYQTLVIDSLDWMERVIWDRVCADYGVKCIEKADGGYGKGYTHALTYWRQVVKILNEIRAKRTMAIILVAHAKEERFEDPDSSMNILIPFISRNLAGISPAD